MIQGGGCEKREAMRKDSTKTEKKGESEELLIDKDAAAKEEKSDGKDEKAKDSSAKKIDTKVTPASQETKDVEDKKKEKKQDEKQESPTLWNRVRSAFASLFSSGKGFETTVSLSQCDLTAEEIEEFRMLSVFTEKEIKILRARFLTLSGNSEWASKQALCTFPELEHNPLKHRIAESFEVDSNGLLDFREFVVGFSALAPNGTREKKLMLAFKVHDYDGDDRISKTDLKQYLSDVTQIAQTEEQLREEKEMEEIETSNGAVDVQARIEFNKNKIKGMQEQAKKDKVKVDVSLVAKLENRVRFLEKEGILDRVVELAFEEASSDREQLTLEDFVRVVGHSDFQGKLVIDLCEKVRIIA